MSKRIKVDGCRGVYYRIADRIGGTGEEKVYYVVYKSDGKVIEAKAGRQFKDNMTPAKAVHYRSALIEGRQLTRQDQRREEAQVSARWTIGRLWDAYKASKPEGVNRSDASFWRVYLEKPFANKEPRELVKLDTDRLRINLLKSKTPQTVKHVVALLRRTIYFGVDRGLCPALPFKITMPSVDNIKTEDLDPEQLQRLLVVLDTTHRRKAAAMMKIALFTGMRRGEIFKLRWEDLDFHRGFITIVEPKGGKSQKIPMNRAAREVFEAIPRRSEYLFPARGGGPRIEAKRDFNAIKAEAELPADFRPMHGLRHLYATLLASSGQVDMFTLQKLLTHKSPQMTQRYVHFRDEAMRQAADKVDDILAEAIKAPTTKLQRIK
jgi:integrase